MGLSAKARNCNKFCAFLGNCLSKHPFLATWRDSISTFGSTISVQLRTPKSKTRQNKQQQQQQINKKQNKKQNEKKINGGKRKEKNPRTKLTGKSGANIFRTLTKTTRNSGHLLDSQW